MSLEPNWHMVEVRKPVAVLINYRHDVYDVTCGSILGMAIAYFSYRRYYPRLRSPKCHEPFPSRETSFNEGFGQIRDDEEAAPNAGMFEMDDSDETA